MVSFKKLAGDEKGRRGGFRSQQQRLFIRGSRRNHRLSRCIVLGPDEWDVWILTRLHSVEIGWTTLEFRAEGIPWARFLVQESARSSNILSQC